MMHNVYKQPQYGILKDYLSTYTNIQINDGTYNIGAMAVLANLSIMDSTFKIRCFSFCLRSTMLSLSAQGEYPYWACLMLCIVVRRRK